MFLSGREAGVHPAGSPHQLVGWAGAIHTCGYDKGAENKLERGSVCVCLGLVVLLEMGWPRA